MQFMGPRTCGLVPVKSAMISSPLMTMVTVISKGSAVTPSSSTHILALYSPSGKSAISARSRLSE